MFGNKGFMCFFFFSSRRRHTRLQGDWSSDVCSSDLGAAARGTGTTTRSPTCSWRDSPPRWSSRSTPSCRGTSPFPSCLAGTPPSSRRTSRSEEHTSELQSPCNLVCRLLLEKKKKKTHFSTQLHNRS